MQILVPSARRQDSWRRFFWSRVLVTTLRGMRDPNRFFGIRNFSHLKLEIQEEPYWGPPRMAREARMYIPF